jgi:hypothetical protein
MGKLRFVALSLAIAACGSDDRNGPADASIDAKVVMPDAKVFMDAPPPTYDLNCYGMTAGTTVGDPIVVMGTAGEINPQTQTISGKVGVTVDLFKVGSTTSAKTVTSGAMGAYTSGDITGGVAIDHLRGAFTDYRTTYLYPPQPIRMTLTGNVPVPLVSNGAFETIEMYAGKQDETKGALLVTVTDCNIADPQLIDGATLHVQQDDADVGDVFDIGQFLPQAAGTYFVMNVPAGDIEVWAEFDGKTFPKRTVGSFAKPDTANAEGTITVTAIPPGPVY